jgi:hypothetical protein
MYTSYYDTSGPEDRQDFVVTSGLYATAETWIAFQEAWEKMLEPYGITYIHMKHFAHNANDGVNNYERFAERPDEKRDLIQAMAGLIREYAEMAPLCVMPIKLYDKWNKNFDLEAEIGSPFGFTAGFCARNTDDWHRLNRPGTALKHLHEQGDTGFCKMRDAVKRYTGVSVQPEDKHINGKYIAPFQATDFIAWEFRRALRDVRVRAKADDDLRRSFRYLREAITDKLRGTEFNEADLLVYCITRPHLQRVKGASLSS